MFSSVVRSTDPRTLLRNRRKRLEPKAPRVWIVPRHFAKEDAYGNQRVFELNIAQRIFVTFDDAGASEFSKYLNICFLLAVVIATVFLVMGTIPSLKVSPESCDEPIRCTESWCVRDFICEPGAPPMFETVQTTCAFIFCIDYFTRLFLVGLSPARLSDTLPKGWEDDVPADMDDEFKEMKANTPDPDVAWATKTYRYFMQPMNLIDLGAIAPFIIEQFKFEIAFGTGFIRMLRLARVFRIFKIGKNNASINLLFLTLSKSLPALMLMGFFLALGVIIFGSTMYICESGTFQINSQYTNTTDSKPFIFARPDLFDRMRDESPFTSIPVSFYWAVTTSTTVGYGDLFPTTMAGRMVCIVSTFCAMIVLALPISVIGNNFNREYDNIKSGKYDMVVESIVELLNQQSVNFEHLSDEEKVYYASRKCVAVTAISEKLLTPIQQEKIKTSLRIRGYEKALESSRNTVTRDKSMSRSRSASISSKNGSDKDMRLGKTFRTDRMDSAKLQKIRHLCSMLQKELHSN